MMVKLTAKSSEKEYFDAIRKSFDLQAEVLTKAITHPGEKGRNNEEFLREFLRKVLPKKFQVGTGFILSSDEAENLSSQTDIVIFDNLLNSPIFSQLVFGVYPIECVYGTIEVKSAAKAKDIRDSLKSIAHLRRLAKCKQYIGYESKNLDDDPTKPVTSATIHSNSLAPRSYVFAFDVAGWTSLKSFSEFVRDELGKQGSAHLHGLYVAKKDWFLWQKPYTAGKVVIHYKKGDGLLRFYQSLLYGISSFEMAPGNLYGYFSDIN